MLLRRHASSVIGLLRPLLLGLAVAASAGATPYEAIAEKNSPKGVCEPLSIHAAADQATTIQLHCITLPGVRLTYSLASGPQHGSASLTPATGVVIYTPAPDYSGPDSFSYVAEHLSITAAATVSIGVGQPPAPAGFALANVVQSHSVWREGSRLASSSRRRQPIGTTFAFALNQPANVTFEFAQQAVGSKSKGKCVLRLGTNDHRRACPRKVIRGRLTFVGHSGRNKLAFQGRLPGARRLPLGPYTLQVTATNAARQHASARPLHFTIVP